ncbi:hypothetical protein CTA1_1747 [Colletotrichum tanaceti]|uniref:Uncharacterized protein n=1 Tax=Colletotrichum tanaceti TaxID=1306861 RepID=A0A4U6X731_9PEZI|nr:hypothetical protein CTA1_1747 [Colletotrichum tanaceti]
MYTFQLRIVMFEDIRDEVILAIKEKRGLGYRGKFTVEKPASDEDPKAAEWRALFDSPFIRDVAQPLAKAGGNEIERIEVRNSVYHERSQFVVLVVVFKETETNRETPPIEPPAENPYDEKLTSALTTRFWGRLGKEKEEREEQEEREERLREDREEWEKRRGPWGPREQRKWEDRWEREMRQRREDRRARYWPGWERMVERHRNVMGKHQFDKWLADNSRVRPSPREDTDWWSGLSDYPGAAARDKGRRFRKFRTGGTRAELPPRPTIPEQDRASYLEGLYMGARGDDPGMGPDPKRRRLGAGGDDEEMATDLARLRLEEGGDDQEMAPDLARLRLEEGGDDEEMAPDLTRLRLGEGSDDQEMA